MSEYVSILDPVPWDSVALSAVQTFVIYWVVILGLKLVGRRVFGELGPQDFIVLLLISEATDLGLTHEDAGFWGTLTSVVVILLTGALIERVQPLKQWLQGRCEVIVRDGKVLEEVLQRSMVDADDVKAAARQYGMPDETCFEVMMLENDGSITGILRPEFRSFTTVSKGNSIG